LENDMTNTKTIRRIAVVGTGVIGASWTALYLARGLAQLAQNRGSALGKSMA
jgi:glycine/D-amino acid oxidase-like deaminating enzyme